MQTEADRKIERQRERERKGEREREREGERGRKREEGRRYNSCDTWRYTLDLPFDVGLWFAGNDTLEGGCFAQLSDYALQRLIKARTRTTCFQNSIQTDSETLLRITHISTISANEY